ncbi:sigma-70 family RNA polymerase sigma factor [Agathobacter rectalis]|uniref:sigma-70 family RNA polymerase sigma factor n=1 Tax=Agathobacter rectalis TaxID=39491 RepID=UPI0027D2D257|nr:sigma-70 family RNA polymerase sigma factor [Agathobacter rectalis]
MTCKTDSSRAKLAKQRMEEKQMAQAMEKDRVIELLEYYKDIDGEVNIYRKIISDLTDQYYNPIGAIQCDGLPKGKNNISRQTENMALNIPDYVSGEIREYEAKAQQLQALKAQILQEVSRLKLKEKRIIFDFYMHNLKWEQVAVRNSYSERQCKNIRDTAVETLSQRFEKNQIISQFQRIA